MVCTCLDGDGEDCDGAARVAPHAESPHATSSNNRTPVVLFFVVGFIVVCILVSFMFRLVGNDQKLRPHMAASAYPFMVLLLENIGHDQHESGKRIGWIVFGVEVFERHFTKVGCGQLPFGGLSVGTVEAVMHDMGQQPEISIARIFKAVLARP